MICLVELVLLFLDWWYQGVLFSYYQEKYSFGYAIQFKDKGVIFNEYAIIVGKILLILIFATLILNLFYLVLSKLSKKAKN